MSDTRPEEGPTLLFLKPLTEIKTGPQCDVELWDSKGSSNFYM